MASAQRGVLLPPSMGENKVMFRIETKLVWSRGCPNSNLLIEGQTVFWLPFRKM